MSLNPVTATNKSRENKMRKNQWQRQHDSYGSILINQRPSTKNISPSLEGIVGATSLFGICTTLILTAYIFWEIGFLPEYSTSQALLPSSLLLVTLIIYVGIFGASIFLPGLLMALVPDISKTSEGRRFVALSYFLSGLLVFSWTVLMVSAKNTQFGAIAGLSMLAIVPTIIAISQGQHINKGNSEVLTKSAKFLCGIIATMSAMLSWYVSLFLTMAVGKSNDIRAEGAILIIFFLVYFFTSVPVLLLAFIREARKESAAMIGTFALLFLQMALSYFGFSPLKAILQHYGVAHIKGGVTVSVSEARCRIINEAYPEFCSLKLGNPPQPERVEKAISGARAEGKVSNDLKSGLIYGIEMRSRFGDNLLISVDRRTLEVGPHPKLKKKDGTEISESQLEALHTLVLSIPKKDIAICTVSVPSKMKLDEYGDIRIDNLPSKLLRPCL
jgi:hypothetical protein